MKSDSMVSGLAGRGTNQVGVSFDLRVETYRRMYRVSNTGFFLSLLTVKMITSIFSQQETYGEPFMYLQQYKNSKSMVSMTYQSAVVRISRP